MGSVHSILLLHKREAHGSSSRHTTTNVLHSVYFCDPPAKREYSGPWQDSPMNHAVLNNIEVRILNNRQRRRRILHKRRSA